MIKWTQHTRDPVDNSVREAVKEWLLSRRKSLPDNDYDSFLVQAVKGKSMLDIGICEHTAEQICDHLCICVLQGGRVSFSYGCSYAR